MNSNLSNYKLSPQDKVLLSIPNVGYLYANKLDGGNSEENLNAIRQLKMDGLIIAKFYTNGDLYWVKLTDLGKLRKDELLRLQNQTYAEWFKNACKSVGKTKIIRTLIKWLFGILTALIIAYLSKQLGLI